MNRHDSAARAPATPDDPAPTGPRVPRQARGQLRVDAILDAAAAAIARDGLAGVTMHALARQARTSIGSLYHFFPDRDGIFDALFERHWTAIRQITRQLNELSDAVWRELSAAAVIERLVVPYVEYVQRNADYLPLLHNRRDGRTSRKDDGDFIRMIRHVLDIRLPSVEPGERQTYAVMLHAVAAGTIQVGFQINARHAEAHLREMPRVLAAYLVEIEAAAGRRRGPLRSHSYWLSDSERLIHVNAPETVCGPLCKYGDRGTRRMIEAL
jgi:AcrR family transcriptional regulator